MFFHYNLRLYLKKLIHKKFNKKIRIKLKENKKKVGEQLYCETVPVILVLRQFYCLNVPLMLYYQWLPQDRDDVFVC
jgi:hypothetical protein